MALLTHAKHAEPLQLPISHTRVANELLINDSIYVKEELTYRKIPIKDIQYIEAFKNYLELHLSEDRHVIRSTMKDFLAILPQSYFLQTHRSFVVNVEKIDAVGGNFIQIDETKIPISRKQKDDVLNRLNFFD